MSSVVVNMPPYSLEVTGKDLSGDPKQAPALPSVAHFAQTGRFLTPPATYRDLLTPLLESFLWGTLPATPATATASERLDDCAPTRVESDGVSNCKASSSAATPRPQQQQRGAPVHVTVQLQFLKVVVFSHPINGFFDDLTLAAPPSSPPEAVARPEGGSGDLAPMDNATARARIVDHLTNPAILFTYFPAFADDSEYLSAKDVCYTMCRRMRLVTHEGIGPMTYHATQLSLDVLGQVVPCVQLVTEVFSQQLLLRLQHMALVPRVLRVGRKLQMSAEEAEALTFILCCQCGRYLAPSIMKLSPAVLATYTNLTPRVMMHLLGDHRLHMKQGIITSDARHRQSFMESTLAIPQEAITALAGDDLSDEQLIKLERTALAEVLLEEQLALGMPAVESMRGPATSRKRRRRTSTLGGGEEEDGVEGSDGEGGSMASHSRGCSEGAVDAEDEGNASVAAAAPSATPPCMMDARDAVLSPPMAPLPTETADSAIVPRGPYTSDVEYMDEAFQLLSNLIKIRSAEGDMKDEEDVYSPKNKVEATLRELKGKVRVANAVHRSRLQATLQAREASRFVPRIELLSERLNLNDLEKMVLLLMVGNVVSHDILVAINGRYVMRDGQRALTVGYLLFVLCDSLKERVAARRSFYRSSPLISHGVVSLTLEGMASRSCFNTDLMDYCCDIDRKIVDYLMGTETETAEMVPGSNLYLPTVPLENIVLPTQTTELVLSTIAHYGMFERCKVNGGFGDGLGNSMSGLVMLFYGPSGTGKTMLANGIAHHLQKQILLVNVAEFRADKKAPEMMRFIFREAKLHDAIIFFDECESLFETREANPLVTSVLAEFERYDGIIVMATNKAQIMDEAMNRRVSLMIEFKMPGHQLREQIWQHHLPKCLALAEDVHLDRLALNFELTGGLIRNAVLAALSHAVAREKSDTPTVGMADLEMGAKRQLRGFFLATESPNRTGGSARYQPPKRSLADLVVEQPTKKRLHRIASLAKSRSTLFSQWGFSEEASDGQASLYLFSGPSGTGKSLATEGIAFECGTTIRLCNIAELLLHDERLETVFEEGRKLGAMIVLDQAQALFNLSERSMQLTQVVQYHAAQYPKPVIVVVTTPGDGTAGYVDARATRMIFSQHITFTLPTRALRQELWRKAFPEKVPLAADVDFAVLSEVATSGKLIRTVAFNVCCKAALLPVLERSVTMKLIKEELEAVSIRERGHTFSGVMYA